MTRPELEQLSQAELIEIILQQQTTILQQQALIEQLQARVTQLEELLKRLTRPPKDASNSSTPPSQTRKPNRPERRPKQKHGPKPGHQGAGRERQAPDLILECRPAACDRCGAGLPPAGGRLLGTSQVVELPPMRRVVLEARRYESACPRCGPRQAAEYPAGLEPQRVFGPRLEALVCYLHHVHHVRAFGRPVAGTFWPAPEPGRHRPDHRPGRRAAPTAGSGDP